MNNLPLVAIGLGSINGAYRMWKGLVQIKKANKLKFIDSRTEADREVLMMAKMRANSQLIPGMKQAIDNINQDAADARKALEQTANSSSTFLAANTIIRRDQDQRIKQLKAQSATSQEFAKRELATELRRQSALQKQDQENHDRSKAILKKNASMNILTGFIFCGFAWLCATGRNSHSKIPN